MGITYQHFDRNVSCLLNVACMACLLLVCSHGRTCTGPPSYLAIPAARIIAKFFFLWVSCSFHFVTSFPSRLAPPLLFLTVEIHRDTSGSCILATSTLRADTSSCESSRSRAPRILPLSALHTDQVISAKTLAGSVPFDP